MRWQYCITPIICRWYESVCTQPNRDEKCKEIIGRFRKYIRMEFVIYQWAVVHTKGSVIFDLPCATGTHLLCGEDNYKYLGILECNMILLTEVKEDVRKKYLAILKEILKVSVSYKNTITSIGTYAMPVQCLGLVSYIGHRRNYVDLIQRNGRYAQRKNSTMNALMLANFTCKEDILIHN